MNHMFVSESSDNLHLQVYMIELQLRQAKSSIHYREDQEQSNKPENSFSSFVKTVIQDMCYC